VRYEEWEVLFRKLLLDRYLAGLNGDVDGEPRAQAAHR
jgi:hypothetical protein